jgi:hypothetical protein
MPLVLSKLPHAIGEGQRLTKILERIRFLQVVLVHHTPTGLKVPVELLQFAPSKRRNPSATRLTLPIGQIIPSAHYSLYRKPGAGTNLESRGRFLTGESI